MKAIASETLISARREKLRQLRRRRRRWSMGARSGTPDGPSSSVLSAAVVISVRREQAQSHSAGPVLLRSPSNDVAVLAACIELGSAPAGEVKSRLVWSRASAGSGWGWVASAQGRSDEDERLGLDPHFLAIRHRAQGSAEEHRQSVDGGPSRVFDVGATGGV